MPVPNLELKKLNTSSSTPKGIMNRGHKIEIQTNTSANMIKINNSAAVPPPIAVVSVKQNRDFNAFF